MVDWFTLIGIIKIQVFIMDTKLEKEYFKELWSKFILLISQVVFREISFNKIFIYAFDLRPNLYKVLEHNNFIFEARLYNHIKLNDKFIDVVIYSKFNFNEKNSNISG